MSDPEHSSRRRHILSSINPDPPPKITRSSRSRSPQRRTTGKRETTRKKKSSQHQAESRENAGQEEPDKNADEDRTRPRRTRLRLKDEKKRHRRSRSRSRSRTRRRAHHDEQQPESTHDRHRRHRHRRRRGEDKRERSPTPPNPYEAPPLDPEAAFRESLFDAMADDEGASYWESVYGQPIHIYSNERPSEGQDGDADGPLERMTDEEYATHVRQKMWEKTHAGILEERARREEARKAKEREDRHARRLQAQVEDSLRRGEERRSRRCWAHRWAEYEKAWEAESAGDLPWPVESGRREDISEATVREFFIHSLGPHDGDAADEEVRSAKVFVAKLKDERVRWHPDKIQQRFGGQVDDGVMRDVTAIFQIIDKLWADTRSKS